MIYRFGSLKSVFGLLGMKKSKKKRLKFKVFLLSSSFFLPLWPFDYLPIITLSIPWNVGDNIFFFQMLDLVSGIITGNFRNNVKRFTHIFSKLLFVSEHCTKIYFLFRSFYCDFIFLTYLDQTRTCEDHLQ